MSEIKSMSFVQSMKDYFGLLPGKSNVDFLREIKALNDEDRKWFRENLPKVGYQVLDSH
jgi:hypothetical protein